MQEGLDMIFIDASNGLAAKEVEAVEKAVKGKKSLGWFFRPVDGFLVKFHHDRTLFSLTQIMVFVGSSSPFMALIRVGRLFKFTQR